MKVSVCMISYNQEKYISEAISSVLMQQANFQIELVISDDNSSDNTYAIINDFYERYPDKIKVIERERNVGMMRNFISTLEECEGDYIAICEGDDYWLDPLKLQKQVDFLDSNPEYVICFHRVYELVDDKKTIAINNPWDEEATLSIEDLAHGNFINTLSVVYRNKLIIEYPIWFESSPVGDYVLHMLNARKGLIKYLPDVMGVYRMYSGVWSIKSAEYRINKFVDVVSCLLTEDFDTRIKYILQKQKQRLISDFCQIMMSKNDLSFLPKMLMEINEESILRDWLLNIYPDKIQSIYASKAYKIANILINIKNKLSFWN